MIENDSESDGLTPKQQALIVAILANVNTVAAAKQAGVAERTARRWLKMPQFERALRRAQADIFRSNITALLRLVPRAILCLNRNMDSPDANSAQVRAAQITLELSGTYTRIAELEVKMADFELLLAEQGIPTRPTGAGNSRKENSPLWRLNHGRGT